MTEILLNPEQAWNAMYIFLRSLWDTEGKKFEGRGTGLGAYLTFSNGQFEGDYQWRREYVKTKGRAFSCDDKISSNQLFELMIGIVLKHQDKYGFNLEPILSLFHSMEDSPFSSQFEWKLWKDALKSASEGGKRSWLLDYVYYGDW